ncbi:MULTISPECIES: succinylglutamate desuccinylase/aspartoacylase family protein [unclassified Pseudomonas]|uniref:succinylglutamate desuccinylase/aspartoacylase domain-containing protein n=1 Tax=unclassified Pseudomonas TaxID=196821 RepID=UPI0011ED11C8|nr:MULTISPECIES: succinylglutamate desuccinylase/aspartoacylase family protein [unclassified Pseudomonas]KAA0943526.1 succinylglutamate desuccinylase/aspartoacylase family protein [Pseudomonas sp. ANT_H4]KAA0950004.1 succinylglutamate desuccinylase/aspartoacylase family protein [Pseudomonas sp. ANT_H14]
MTTDLSWHVPGDSGNTLHIGAWRIEGDGSGPRVHLQAGVHADEIAGMLVLHQLLPRLQACADQGRLKGSVTVVPQANPFGIGQFRQGRQLGRFHEATGQNFNRGFDHSLALDRPASNLAQWQKSLVQLAAEAELVLDLHTDDEAVPYLYIHRSFWPQGQALAAALKVDLAILWDDGGDGSFEETIIAHAGPRLAATIELRGQGDVSDQLAQQDGDGIWAWLCASGVIDEPAVIGDWQGQAVDMGCMETILAPCPGVLVFEKGLGDEVEEGQRFARIIGRPGQPDSEVVLRAAQTGRMVTRHRERLVAQGSVVAKFTGSRVSESWSGGVLDP